MLTLGFGHSNMQSQSKPNNDLNGDVYYMAEKKTRKANRTKEQIIKEFDDKIAYHEKCIESLKAKKEEVLNPKVSPKQQLKAVLAKAEESGLSPEDIAKKLGISL